MAKSEPQETMFLFSRASGSHFTSSLYLHANMISCHASPVADLQNNILYLVKILKIWDLPSNMECEMSDFLELCFFSSFFAHLLNG